jgi:hypothetical protein
MMSTRLRRCGMIVAAVALAACETVYTVDPGPEDSDTAAAPGSQASCSDGTACDADCVDLLTDPRNCGGCGITCVPPNGTAACVAGSCALAECEQGFADCDGDVETGCELPIDCPEGGSCVTECGSTGGLLCSDPCTPTCAAPPEACNAQDDDCNAVCDEGAIPGCRVAVHRAYNGTNGHLFTTDLAEAEAWGLESASFFYLYVDATADLRPLFRCPKAGTGNYLLTSSTDYAALLTTGFIAPEPVAPALPSCGSVPLYRLHYPPNNWHFYTLSAPERDSAIAGGWVDQGLAGYVWTTL